MVDIKKIIQTFTRGQYLIGALCFIAFEYYLFIFQFMREWIDTKAFEVTIILIFYHIILFLLLWSMHQSIRSDPGRVPKYWGVILDDSENKKRRYCLLCHQFKPERSHHCQTCERCVLNMDHHCPWIMNCIGFDNRKFFILMVFYISLAAIYMITFEILVLIDVFFKIEEYALENLAFKALGFMASLMFGGVIINFFYFHIKLLLTNTTTLETMEKQRQEQNGNPVSNENAFNFGAKYNWYQVFGLNPYLWPFPIFGESGKPLGDGVTWDKFKLQYDPQDNNPNIVILQPQSTGVSTSNNTNIGFPNPQYGNQQNNMNNPQPSNNYPEWR